MEINTLIESLHSTNFPSLGKRVGDFVLYDSLLGGYASRAAKGEKIPAMQIPVPDKETTDFVAVLKEKQMTTEEEKVFLKYFENLEAIRKVLLN